MTLSDELKTLYASSGTDVILETLEINHSSFTSPFYLVRDWQDLTATLEGGQSVTFQKYSFNLVPESKDGSGTSSLRLSIDNVNRDVVDKLETAIVSAGNVPLTVYYRLYLSSDTTGPQNNPPVLFYLTDIQVTLDKLVATAEIPGLINRSFPNVDYKSTVFKSLGRAV